MSLSCCGLNNNATCQLRCAAELDISCIKVIDVITTKLKALGIKNVINRRCARCPLTKDTSICFMPVPSGSLVTEVHGIVFSSAAVFLSACL